ncbi:MAG: glycosyltransferase [Planctomycetota bacterium]
MLVSVIIPCHRGVRDTRACVGSLLAQTAAGPDLALEILVVDNGSDDGTADLDQEFSQVQVLRLPSNLGFAGGVNRGLTAARGSYLVVLNNDTLAAPNLVARLLRPLLQDDSIGITAPVSNHVKGPARLDVGAAVGLDTNSRAELERTLADFARGKIQDVDTLAGLCLMFSRETWQRIGAFDESFGLGNYEDDDFCLRARLLGYRLVIVRDAFLHHHGHRTFDALGVDYKAAMHEQAVLFDHKWRRDPAGRVVLSLLDDDLGAAARAAPAGLAQHPAWPDGHLVLARWHARQEQHDDAIPHLHGFLARCPRHTDGQVLLAFQLVLAGDERAGNERLAQAMQDCYFSETTTADVLSLRGRWLLQQQRATEAEAALLAALELQPDNAGILSLVGVCQWQLGRYQEGLTTLARCAVESPGDPAVGENLEKALSMLESGGVDVDGLRARVAALSAVGDG